LDPTAGTGVVAILGPPKRRGSHASSIPAVLFVGLTVAATGGPLSLAAALVPSVLGDAQRSSGLVAVLGAVLFLPALLIWLRYSQAIASAGGLYSFVEVAAGRRVAQVQAALWIISYGMYLVYTVAYLAYDLVPAVFPATVPYRMVLQLVIAVGVAAVMLLPLRGSLSILTTVALAQLVLVAALGVSSVGVLGAPTSAFLGHGQPLDVGLAGANTALLFICASLPLFLAGEVAGGSTRVRKGLATGWALVAVVTVAAVIPLASAGKAVLGAEVPGMAIVRGAGPPMLATAIGIGAAASVLGVVAAEFLALSRLLHALTAKPISTISRLLAAFLVAGSAVSLVNPLRVYRDLLVPSLVALWLSQLIVFAVYPRFEARRGQLSLGHVALACAASALMVFGLYSTLANQLGA
jgi:amino acid transporter